METTDGVKVAMRLLILLLEQRGATGFGLTTARILSRLFEMGIERIPALLSLKALKRVGLIGSETVETGDGNLSDYISLTERGVEVAGAVKELRDILKADQVIIATPDGRFYSEFWSEKDDFKRRRIREVSRQQATEYCRGFDYVVHRPLTLTEKVLAKAEAVRRA